MIMEMRVDIWPALSVSYSLLSNIQVHVPLYEVHAARIISINVPAHFVIIFARVYYSASQKKFTLIKSLPI